MRTKSFAMSGRIYLFIFIVLCCLWGCNQGGDDPILPTYLKLNKPIVLDPSGAQSDFAIKDFWVDQNGQSLGVQPLPTVIPALIPSEGSVMTFAGGVFENGFSFFRTPYPFIRGVTQVIEPSPLDTVDIDLTLEYLSPDTVLQFALDEDFNSAISIFESNTQGSNFTSLFNSTEAAFQGVAGGKVTFTSSRYEFAAKTKTRYALPQRGNNDVWMEITYKGDVPFSVGINYYFVLNPGVGQIDAGNFLPSPDEWNIVYIHINDAIRSLPEAAVFEPFIEATARDGNGTPGREGFIFFDNIRIVHFRP